MVNSHKYKHTQTLLYMIMGTINGHKRTSKLFIKKKDTKINVLTYHSFCCMLSETMLQNDRKQIQYGNFE